ncbi:GGDEF domain-containing protein [Roseibium sp.]|uniref:GGDEF domain-containing protein n=1 Tax=Roseibium sp. TaxID=1936156 RepID=UPI003A9839CF
MDLANLPSYLLAANGLVYAFFIGLSALAVVRRPGNRAVWYWAMGLWLPGLAVGAALMAAGSIPERGLEAEMPEWAPETMVAAGLMVGQVFLWFGFRAFQERRVWSFLWLPLCLPVLAVLLRVGAGYLEGLPSWFSVAPFEHALVLFTGGLCLALSVLTLETRRAGDIAAMPNKLALSGPKASARVLRKRAARAGRLPGERLIIRILRAASLAPILAIPFCFWAPLDPAGGVLSPIWLVVLTSALVLTMMATAYCLPVIGRERAERRIEALETNDRLTGLLNRAAFVKALRAALLADPDGGTLLLMDIDRFKRINDSHGHDAGDAVLACYADFLKSFAMDSTLCGRLGSGEFALYLKGLSGPQLDMLASQVCRAASILQCEHKGHIHRFTVSVGVADTQNAGLEFERLYEQADQALCEAKESGRDRYCRTVAPKPEASIAKSISAKSLPFAVNTKAG